MKQINPKSQQEWREWLERNHNTESNVALIHFKKHTGKRAMSVQEAMDEAICFGWIDTTVKRLDEDTYIQQFVKRTSKGRFSQNTIKYAKRLIKDGKMAPAGMKAYKQGLINPLTDGHIPKYPDPPKELLEALEKNKTAKEFFEAMTPSMKRMHFRWLLTPKLEETKNKRINKLVELFSNEKNLW